jgi:hypothetical protein
MLAARVISVLVIFYSFNCLIHFAVEDALGLTPQGTLLGYEYGRYMACLIVGVALFLGAMHFKRKRSELFIERIDTEKKLYTTALLSCIGICVIYSTRILYLYLSGKADTPILLNILVTIFIILIGGVYLYLEQRNISDSNFKLYCGLIYSLFVMFLFVGGYCMRAYAPPFVLRSINEDLTMLRRVNEIAAILKEKHNVFDSQEEVINELGYYQNENFYSGAVKYQKEDENKFSLSWSFKTKKKELLRIKRLKYICREAHVFLKDDYHDGVNTQVFECLLKKTDKAPAPTKK